MPTNTKKSEETMMFSWIDDSVDEGFSREPENNNESIDEGFTMNPDLENGQNTDDDKNEEPVIPPLEDDEEEEEKPEPKRIMNISCCIKKSINISILYEDGTTKDVLVSKGDKVEVTYVHEAALHTERGLILAILIGPARLNRITNKVERIYSLKLDCSTRYSSKEKIVYCELIRDIDIIYSVEDDEIEIDKEYLDNKYFDKREVDYLMSWQDIDGVEIE